ncbi:hypothetical protein BD408DRAFT_432474 [Parasitella parasitica]|nr:hypothetical protein BD408DRAFT_432474 [Parasitella parasitica]
MDVICTLFIGVPFIIHNICSIGSAAIAEHEVAKALKNAGYYILSIHLCILAFWVFVAGLQLIKILKQHLHNQIDAGDNAAIEKVKNGLFKVRMTMTICIVSLFIFVLLRFLYSFLNTYFSQNYALNLAMSILLTYDGILASTLVVLTVVFNPKALSSFNLTSSNQNMSDESQIDKSAFTTTTDDLTLITSRSETQKDSCNYNRRSFDYSKSPV